MNNIFGIYIENIDQGYIIAIWWLLNVFRKYDFFINLKKCWFYKDEIQFLDYIILAQSIKIENKQIKVIKNWLELKSIKGILVFLEFVNFYWCVIQKFSKIAALLILITKTTRLLNAPTPIAIKANVNEIFGSKDRLKPNFLNLKKRI